MSFCFSYLSLVPLLPLLLPPFLSSSLIDLSKVSVSGDGKRGRGRWAIT